MYALCRKTVDELESLIFAQNEEQNPVGNE
jgi:hypothetical protein